MTITMFAKNNGTVVAYQDPALPGRAMFRLQGWEGFSGFKSIITRVAMSAQGNFQFLHTLGGNIFVYVFGDRIGQITIAGIAFDSPCWGVSGPGGIEHVLNYYQRYRISQRATPIKVTIGGSGTVQGYLTNFAATTLDPETRMYQFNLQMLMPPLAENGCESNDEEDQAGGNAAAGDDAAAGDEGAAEIGIGVGDIDAISGEVITAPPEMYAGGFTTTTFGSSDSAGRPVNDYQVLQ